MHIITKPENIENRLSVSLSDTPPHSVVFNFYNNNYKNLILTSGLNEILTNKIFFIQDTHNQYYICFNALKNFLNHTLNQKHKTIFNELYYYFEQEENNCYQNAFIYLKENIDFVNEFNSFTDLEQHVYFVLDFLKFNFDYLVEKTKESYYEASTPFSFFKNEILIYENIKISNSDFDNLIQNVNSFFNENEAKIETAYNKIKIKKQTIDKFNVFKLHLKTLKNYNHNDTQNMHSIFYNLVHILINEFYFIFDSF